MYKHIETLIRTDDEVADDIPCKADILSVRECRKDGKVRNRSVETWKFECFVLSTELTLFVLPKYSILLRGVLFCRNLPQNITIYVQPCDDLGLELLKCMAQYKVDTTEKIRQMMGVAKYNEYVKSMVDKYGQEKADEIIAEPVEQLKDIQAYQILHRVANNTNPKGTPPKSTDDLKNWTHVDQVRSEMGEQEWWDSVRIVGYEFGLDKVDALFGITKEKELIESAQDRLVPGMKEKRAEVMAGLKKIEESVKEAAPGAKSHADYAAAFKDLYPTKEDLEAALK